MRGLRVAERPLRRYFHDGRLIQVQHGEVPGRVPGAEDSHPARVRLFHDHVRIARPALLNSLRENFSGGDILDGDPRAAHVRSNDFGVARDRANHHFGFFAAGLSKKRGNKNQNGKRNRTEQTSSFHRWPPLTGTKHITFPGRSERDSLRRRAPRHTVDDAQTDERMIYASRKSRGRLRAGATKGEKSMSEFSRRSFLGGAVAAAAATMWTEPVHAQYVWQKTDWQAARNSMR